jgi:hypothetical protein
MKGLFMISFLCDIGYKEGVTGRGYDNMSINDIPIIDSNAYVSIGTQYKASFPNSEKTVDEFIETSVTSFGDDFYKIWLLYSGTKDNYSTSAYVKGWVPSANYMYPNMWHIVEESPNGTKIQPIFIFKKLKKAVTINGYYSIDDNGILHFVSTFSYTVWYTDQKFYYPIIPNYTSETDLSRTNYSVLYASVNTTGKRPSYIETSGYEHDHRIQFLHWLFEDNPKPDIIDDDPYSPGGNSDLAGGDGDFDGSSTPIDFPDLPTLSAVDTGLISLFNPSVAEIKSLATFMWGPPFDMENWKKLFANPMDALLGLSIVPVHVPDGGQGTVKVGNIDTNISMNKAGSQYTEVDCGTLNVNEYWGAYLDYEPYTHVQIYLPYIGVKEISTDDVMSKSVHIKYHVDILSGACVAYVKCGTSVLYSFTGQCAASIPITGRDYTGVVQSAINIVSSAMGMFAMGQSASALGQAANLAKTAGASAKLSAGAARNALGAASGAANIASEAINITKPVIQKSANISSAAGLLGIQVPYMILTRPRQCLPANQNHYIGYPSMITSPLSSCSGFTVVEAIHLENIGATEEEIAEIEEILHAGVIF